MLFNKLIFNGPPYYVDLHVNTGESVSIQWFDGKKRLLCGPATITMISQQPFPPVPMPVQMPPGHMIQQIVDENGTLTHIILSPTTKQENQNSSKKLIDIFKNVSKKNHSNYDFLKPSISIKKRHSNLKKIKTSGQNIDNLNRKNVALNNFINKSTSENTLNYPICCCCCLDFINSISNQVKTNPLFVKKKDSLNYGRFNFKMQNHLYNNTISDVHRKRSTTSTSSFSQNLNYIYSNLYNEYLNRLYYLSLNGCSNSNTSSYLFLQQHPSVQVHNKSKYLFTSKLKACYTKFKSNSYHNSNMIYPTCLNTKQIADNEKSSISIYSSKLCCKNVLKIVDRKSINSNCNKNYLPTANDETKNVKMNYLPTYKAQVQQSCSFSKQLHEKQIKKLDIHKDSMNGKYFMQTYSNRINKYQIKNYLSKSEQNLNNQKQKPVKKLAQSYSCSMLQDNLSLLTNETENSLVLFVSNANHPNNASTIHENNSLTTIENTVSFCQDQNNNQILLTKNKFANKGSLLNLKEQLSIELKANFNKSKSDFLLHQNLKQSNIQTKLIENLRTFSCENIYFKSWNNETNENQSFKTGSHQDIELSKTLHLKEFLKPQVNSKNCNKSIKKHNNLPETLAFNLLYTNLTSSHIKLKWTFVGKESNIQNNLNKNYFLVEMIYCKFKETSNNLKNYSRVVYQGSRKHCKIQGLEQLTKYSFRVKQIKQNRLFTSNLLTITTPKPSKLILSSKKQSRNGLKANYLQKKQFKITACKTRLHHQSQKTYQNNEQTNLYNRKQAISKVFLNFPFLRNVFAFIILIFIYFSVTLANFIFELFP